MSTPHDGVNPAARRSRNLLVTFLGAVVRRLGNWMPIAGTIELTGELGLDEASVRTAVSRLKKRGWLDPEVLDGVRGYRLTAHALDELAAGDEVIWHARQPADLGDGWCVVNFSVPESARTKRHQLRTHLAALGFGNISAAVWIAPARMQDAATKAIAELDLLDHCALFAGSHVGGKDLRSLLHEAWDLSEIERSYAAFIDAHQHLTEGSLLSAMPGDDAFVTYLGVVDRWRKLPYRDPGLPLEVLPEDWNGPIATALFEKLVAALEADALVHAARHWTTR
ncbi:PaaX family transcriptional regulator [Cryptosporangium aurantiacum]|uniref:Transcriptional regulator, PaaX family n=1 Tax=Cryptosporangium aurantiacum TaxID=134849 RepID=A0A1M7R1D2_9ACTN|nr:PaaX family transcriptional regulator C-terminal domain-containing protein [Cryptosporangium aurantiacum]SHN38504.1 transcriptional regulator, PaaX family [Cryptosporangium aurantiacum]